MKRSEINAAILRARETLRLNKFYLPDFAYWTQEKWQRQLPYLSNLRESGLGWDVTDFGSGDFAHCGSVLFTLRNGRKDDLGIGTPYAEKLIFQMNESEQEIPFHFHIEKTEDIINRGGGILMLSLYNSLPGGKLDPHTPVHVRMDGITRTLDAGSSVSITPGNSITLTPGLYHRFWAKKGEGNLLTGEVSSINDDNIDNTFLHTAIRFTPIEEDEPPLCPLCNEYERFPCGNTAQ